MQPLTLSQKELDSHESLQMRLDLDSIKAQGLMISLSHLSRLQNFDTDLLAKQFLRLSFVMDPFMGLLGHEAIF